MVKHGDVNEVPPTLSLMNMINGAWLSQAIAVAAKLAIPDLLADGPKTSAALAESTPHACAARPRTEGSP